MSEETIRAIEQGYAPQSLDSRGLVIHEFVSSILYCSDVDDALYEQARNVLEEKALVELVAIVGYYTLVSYTLNVFHIAS